MRTFINNTLTLAARPAVWAPFAILLALVTIVTGAWNWLEPFTGVLTLAAAAVAVIQTRRARQAVYADNGDGSWVVALGSYAIVGSS